MLGYLYMGKLLLCITYMYGIVKLLTKNLLCNSLIMYIFLQQTTNYKNSDSTLSPPLNYCPVTLGQTPNFVRVRRVATGPDLMKRITF